MISVYLLLDLFFEACMRMRVSVREFLSFSGQQ